MNLNKFYCPAASGVEAIMKILPPQATIVILDNGREHNMIVESLEDGVVYGRAGLVRHVCLYEPAPGARLILLVDTREAVQRQLSRGKEINIHYESSCWLMSEARMGVDADDISLVESPLSIVFDHDPHLPGGGIDEAYVVSVIPALKRYQLSNGGFASNTAAAALAPFARPVIHAQGPPQANPGAVKAAGLVKRVPLASAVIEEFERPELETEPEIDLGEAK